MGAARGCDSPLPLREVTWFARDRRSKRGSCTATNYLIYGCARLDGDSHVVENEILIARESVGSGAQGESTECKLDKLCRTGKGDPMTSFGKGAASAVPLSRRKCLRALAPEVAYGCSPCS